MLIIGGSARLEGECKSGDELGERRRNGLIEGVVLNAELRAGFRIETLVVRPGVQVAAGDRDARRTGVEARRVALGHRDRRRELAQAPEARVRRELVVVEQS